MEQTEYKVDRSRFGPGPWDEEPEDRIEWRHNNVPCLMVRSSGGYWCGYVAVNAGHPWYGHELRDLWEVTDIDVHGGPTYSRECQGVICHVPQSGESDEAWWVGFDCAHLGDRAPMTEALTGSRDHYATYRDTKYAKREVEKLAEQALAAHG
jgi:hypothetical protein